MNCHTLRCWRIGLILWSLPICSALPNQGPAVRLERVPENGLQPQAVVDQHGTLHLIYLRGDPKACDVIYRRRLAGQAGFSLPVRVNSKPGSAIAIGTVRGAQLALGREGFVHVVWNGSGNSGGKTSGASPMLYTRLAPGADAFEPQRDLMTSTTHLDG